jgi:lysozyme
MERQVRNPRIIVAALTLSAAGLVGLVSHEGYSDNAIIPVPGDVLTNMHCNPEGD